MDMRLTQGAVDFIDDERIFAALNQKEDAGQVDAVLAKSMEKKPLTLDEAAALLVVRDPQLLERIFEAARKLKRDIYGNRIVLFAPLYIGNHCVNDCLYCGFRRSLKTTVRRTLSDEELIAEVKGLENLGHKRLILVYGESPLYSPEFIAHTVQLVYQTKERHGEIRRVNINAAPLDIEGFKTVKSAGIGTFQVFQETYHKPTYAEYHPANTLKGNYMWRLNAMDRAFEAGCDDMGIGALFGLYDWKFEAMGLVSHALHLQGRYGVGPHTISFPRIQPANGLDFALRHAVSDADFKHLVAVLRLAVPYTGLIMTAREKESLRNEVMQFGVSQIDAGTRLEIGAYHEKESATEAQDLEKEQFQIADNRSLDDTIRWLVEQKFIPSFCTSCYRVGRTGEHFMEYAIPGFIGKFCTPNALMTLAEYLKDYGSEATVKAGKKLISEELASMPESDLKKRLLERLDDLEKNDTRDRLF
ncbi:MAG: [FeFe] hydrogenase H-cluster radical SAM maturase HydG [Bacteroides sp.]|nr:[FeFe] hydrogenase H-cluster radical SAM maturase HydG [Bacteroides sp.]MCM1084961.1 [FeFe] hydrogenase H-cluster radical SAM maturase HydG [Bacteroides sp.]